VAEDRPVTEPLDNVLFAALDLDLFGRLATASKSVDELAAETGLLRSRLEILLTACVSLGLLVKHADAYGNAPASQAYLVRGAPATSAITIASRSIARSTRHSPGCRTRYAVSAPISIASWTTRKRR
jgi:Dimerisation domain